MYTETKNKWFICEKQHITKSKRIFSDYIPILNILHTNEKLILRQKK